MLLDRFLGNKMPRGGYNMDSRSDPNAKRTMDMGTLTAKPEDVVIGDKGGAVEEEVDIVQMQTVTAGQMVSITKY